RSAIRRPRWSWARAASRPKPFCCRAKGSRFPKRSPKSAPGTWTRSRRAAPSRSIDGRSAAPRMKLYAIGDLHLRHESNRQALLELPHHPEDWLILAGDMGETEEHLRFALTILTRRFARLLWVPGNHDLWTVPPHPDVPRGVRKYERLVAICRSFGALTPEDPFVDWPGEGPATILAPLFLLYDYTFRPDDVPVEDAIGWAAEEDVLCSDEVLLHPDPYPSRAAWCEARCADAERKLEAAAGRGQTVLINHWPLRQ